MKGKLHKCYLLFLEFHLALQDHHASFFCAASAAPLAIVSVTFSGAALVNSPVVRSIKSYKDFLTVADYRGADINDIHCIYTKRSPETIT